MTCNCSHVAACAATSARCCRRCLALRVVTISSRRIRAVSLAQTVARRPAERARHRLQLLMLAVMLAPRRAAAPRTALLSQHRRARHRRAVAWLLSTAPTSRSVTSCVTACSTSTLCHVSALAMLRVGCHCLAASSAHFSLSCSFSFCVHPSCAGGRR